MLAVNEAEANAIAAHRPLPKFVAISESDIEPFIDELRENSGNYRVGFNHNQIRKMIEEGTFRFWGVTVIVKERVVA